MAGRALQPRRTLGLATLLLLLAVGLVYVRARQPQPAPESAVRNPPAGQASTVVEFDRFAAHRERSPDGERLSVALRLRVNQNDLRCFLFIVARNEHSTPKLWSIWPAEASGSAITSGGYFHGAKPSVGYPLLLTGRWQRVDATIADPQGKPAFDTVVVYLLDAQGRVLLARPFKV